MKKKLILGVITVLFASLFFSCKNSDVDVKLLEGTYWLHVKSGKVLSFDKDGETMHSYHITSSECPAEQSTYNYIIQDRKITLQYRGPLKILVPPSTHSIKLKNDELTIDFSNGGYGFEKEVYVFKKTVE